MRGDDMRTLIHYASLAVVLTYLLYAGGEALVRSYRRERRRNRPRRKLWIEGLLK
jgi:hypothetical protein